MPHSRGDKLWLTLANTLHLQGVFTLWAGTQTLPSPLWVLGVVPFAPLWLFFPRPYVDFSQACANLYQLKTQGDLLQLSGALSSLTLFCVSSGCLGVWPAALSPPPLGRTCRLDIPRIANWGNGNTLCISTPSQFHCPMPLIAQCLKTVVSSILSGCLR